MPGVRGMGEEPEPWFVVEWVDGATGPTTRDDDRYWKGGLVYVNRDLGWHLAHRANSGAPAR